MREIRFAGSSAMIPEDAAAMAEHIYGPSWRNPNPGFDWSRDRTQYAAEGIPADHLIEEVYWADFYANSYDTGSSFFDLVNSRNDLPDMVVDIGCGDGRDSYAFARAGRQVLGVDRSHVAVAHATKKAQEMRLTSPVAFTPCDVSDSETLRATLTAARGENPDRPVLFYARFFLHSIPEDVQRLMMMVIQQCSRHGDCFAAEFRTDKDEATAKVHGEHYRRFQNGPSFGRQLSREYGFTPSWSSRKATVSRRTRAKIRTFTASSRAATTTRWGPDRWRPCQPRHGGSCVESSGGRASACAGCAPVCQEGSPLTHRRSRPLGDRASRGVHQP